MKTMIITVITFICSTAFSQTQIDLNNEACTAFKKADSTLNGVYQKILAEYKSDSIFIRNLKASQRIWITFRDAELKMKYPEREPGYYGSIHPLCVEDYLEKLTGERIRTLSTWLQGIEEGDACFGSVKTIP